MKGYEGGSFSDKSFAAALSLSLVWHLFWFSLVTVGMNPEKKLLKPRSRIVFLGSVLDEKIFRTLLENRLELSKGLPRKFSELSEPADAQIKTAQRQGRGSVVTLPLEKKSRAVVGSLIEGTKALPPQEIKRA